MDELGGGGRGLAVVGGARRKNGRRIQTLGWSAPGAVPALNGPRQASSHGFVPRERKNGWERLGEQKEERMDEPDEERAEKKIGRMNQFRQWKDGLGMVGE